MFFRKNKSKAVSMDGQEKNKSQSNVSRVHHICIQTLCYESSYHFYKNVLGFDLIKETTHFHSRLYNTWLSLGDFMIELQTNKENEKLYDYSQQSNGIVHFCLLVNDVESEYKRLKRLGFDNFKAKHGSDIYDVEGSKLMKVYAPEGTIIEFRDQSDL